MSWKYDHFSIDGRSVKGIASCVWVDELSARSSLKIQGGVEMMGAMLLKLVPCPIPPC